LALLSIFAAPLLVSTYGNFQRGLDTAHRLPRLRHQPSLSPDGHMLVFIRGPETFITDGQIYLKFLPDGPAVQLTHDDRPKLSPVFSPDGSRIAYTALENFNWNTYQIPVTGGESRLLLPNASGLTWVDSQRLLFSKSKLGHTWVWLQPVNLAAMNARFIYRLKNWGWHTALCFTR
jgi:Tol biopolymer transport system component